MARCEVCGNDSDRAFQVVAAGKTHTFDSFECAIHALAPVCEHCGCTIVGHGIEAGGVFYCCAHCAHEEGATSVVDNAAHSAAPMHTKEETERSVSRLKYGSAGSGGAEFEPGPGDLRRDGPR
jgi:hypothetical protein